MSDQSLIVATGFSVTGISQKAEETKNALLERSGCLGAVRNSDQNKAHFAVAAEINDLCKQTDDVYETLARPALDYLAALRKAKDGFKGELRDEESRLNAAMGDYALLEGARLKDAMLAADATLSDIDQRRHDALSKCTTHEERDLVNSAYDEEAAALKPPVVQSKAEGQSLAPDWSIEVQDIHNLYRNHPQCVKLTPLISEIKNLLRASLTVRGVVATPIVRTEYRGRKSKVVEI